MIRKINLSRYGYGADLEPSLFIIEYDTLAKEMPDMISVLEFVPGIVCELSNEEFASELCADDVRAFLKSREDRTSLMPLPTLTPYYLRGCIRRFLAARHGGRKGAY